MATANKQPLPPPRNPHVPEPKSWVYLGAGFAVLIGAAIALGVLLAYFMEQRPANLREHAFKWVAYLEKSLMAAGMAENNIQRQPGIERRDKTAIWLYYSLDVRTPEGQDPNRVLEFLRAAVADKGLRVSDGVMEDARRELHLSMGTREFLSIAVLGTVPPPPKPAELHQAGLYAAQCVQQAVLPTIAPKGTLSWRAAEEMSDAEASWTFWLGEVSFCTPRTVAEFASEVGHSIHDPNMEVKGQHGGGVSVFYMGKCCVELACIVLPPSPPPGPVDFSREGSPEESYRVPLIDLAESTGHYDLLNIILPGDDELPLDSVEHSGPDNGLVHAPAPLAPNQAIRVAIILDDGGYGGVTTNKIIDMLDPQLTLALLPNTPNVKDTALRAAAKGFQIMLHMPMQTHSKTIKPFPGQLNTNMAKEEIERLTADAIGQVPGIVGVNNHTGSKFTEDVEGLTYFMNVVKQKGLFFVDSRTLGTSKAYAVARAMGVRAGQRNIFLDNSADPVKIRAAFQKLISRAKTHGQAIGIGHFREKTVAVLSEELPKLKAEGVTLVHVSELVQ